MRYVADMPTLRPIERSSPSRYGIDMTVHFHDEDIPAGLFADAGSIYLYHRGRTHQPLKVRVFIDFLTDRFRSERFAERFRADLA